MLRNRFKGILKPVVGLVAFGLCMFLVLYLKVKIYDFPQHSPFSGDSWYVPYQDLGDTLLRANFHAHSRCWGGLTNGDDSPDQLAAAYRQEGYTVPGISNYQSVWVGDRSEEAFIPLYEHGVNWHKIHNLAIDARRVSHVLFPYHFSIHQKQQEILAVERVASLVALAHPTDARYPRPQLERLTGFQLMEIGHSTGIEEEQWDLVLSTGKPVWILCNDDTHSLQNEPPFNRWTRIYCQKPERTHILESLKKGNHYGVWAYDDQCEDNRLTTFSISNDTLHIALRDSANRIDLIGQNGIQRATVAGDHEIRYHLQPDDTYIRAEVHHDHGIMYLNPVFRYDGTWPSEAEPAVRVMSTWATRLVVLIILIGIVTATRATLRSLQRTNR